MFVVSIHNLNYNIMTTIKEIYLSAKEFKKIKVTQTFPNPEIVVGTYKNELIKATLAKSYKVVELSQKEKQWFGANPELDCLEVEFKQWVPIDLFLGVVNREYSYKNNKFGIQDANGSLGSRSMIVERNYIDKIIKKLKQNGFTYEKSTM